MLINVKPQQDKNVDMGLESLSSKISITQKAKKRRFQCLRKKIFYQNKKLKNIFR